MKSFIEYCLSNTFGDLSPIHNSKYCRAIVTAGHCVCSQRKKDKDLYPECMLNTDKENPLNQIVTGRDIFYVVGKKTSTIDYLQKWKTEG